MTANLLIGFCAALAATGMFLIGAYCHEPVESARSSLRSWCVRVHTRRVPDYGRHSGIPAPETAEARYERITAENVGVITTPLLAAREHADAMWQASEPYLPPSPQGENPYPPYVPDPRAIPTADGEHVTCPACGFRDGRHNPDGCRRQDTLYRRAGRAVEPVKADGHAPWTGSQPVLDDEAEAAEQMRLEYVRSHLADAAEVTPELMQEVLAGLRALPVYGERPELEVREAERLAAGLIA